MIQPESNISNAPDNDSFAVSFMHLESRRARKEDCMKVGGDWSSAVISHLSHLTAPRNYLLKFCSTPKKYVFAYLTKKKQI